MLVAQKDALLAQSADEFVAALAKSHRYHRDVY
jgi:sulfite reductase alpha subunit-like flavoprotein